MFDKTISIPDAPSITDVSISTPDEPINVTWQQSSTPSMYAAKVWLAGGPDYGYIDFLMLSGSARSFTIAANATGLEEINQWSIELHSFNIVQHENNAVLANRHDYKSSQSRFHTWKSDLHNMDNRGLSRLLVFSKIMTRLGVDSNTNVHTSTSYKGIILPKRGNYVSTSDSCFRMPCFVKVGQDSRVRVTTIV